MPSKERRHVGIAHKLTTFRLGVAFLNRCPFFVGNLYWLGALSFNELQHFDGVCLPFGWPTAYPFKDSIDLFVRHSKII